MSIKERLPWQAVCPSCQTQVTERTYSCNNCKHGQITVDVIVPQTNVVSTFFKCPRCEVSRTSLKCPGCGIDLWSSASKQVGDSHQRTGCAALGLAALCLLGGQKLMVWGQAFLEM
jgi:hypothetical protein